MPPARTPARRYGLIPGYQATAGTGPERAARDVLPGHLLARHIDDFLADLANANKPRNTIRAYRGDLIAFAAHHDGDIAGLTAAPVRAFLGEVAGQAPATRKRKRAAVASFCRWAVRHDLLEASPVDRIDAIEVPKTLPRPAAAADVAAVLDAICSRRPRKDVPLGVLRDRVLFETAYVCGARASEVCGMYVEDLDLRPDDEHARVHGKGGTVRTVLLDDRGYVALLRLYLARAGYTSGPLFRASINGRGGPLSYDAAHSRWKKYCAAAGAGIGIHQLRHAHASELKVSGVASAASFGGSRERRGPGLRGQRRAGWAGTRPGRHAA
jgi:integrase/recombinase XerC/integrase/recombinase XerD